MFSRIVIGTDFSDPSTAALFAGISMAERCLAKIEVIHITTFLEDLRYSAGSPAFELDWKLPLQSKLETFFPKELYPNSVRLGISAQSIPSEILKYSRQRKADLIILGSHGRNIVEKLLIGSVTQAITRNSEIPVMVVRDIKRVKRPYQAYGRILVATDFSGISLKAVDFGVRLTNFLQAELHLIHVVELPELIYHDKNPCGQIKVPTTCELNVDSTLKRMIETREYQGIHHVETLFGDPVTQILDYANKNNVDFLVIGTHGREGTERLMLGSVTERILSKLSLPVFTISNAKISGMQKNNRPVVN
jgi:nucleotide-binding universal stress UspA family protein